MPVLNELSSLLRCFSEVWIISGGENNTKIAARIVPAAALESDEILYWPAVQTFSHLTPPFLTSLPSITASFLLCFVLHMLFANYVLLKLLYGNVLGKLSSLPYLE